MLACCPAPVLAADPTAAAGSASAQSVDFRYALPWWQSLVCRPDDPDKPLVGKEGQFFFDYGQKGPRKFAFSVALEFAGGSQWRRQETASPRVPLLLTTKEADGVEVQETAFLDVSAAGDPDPALRLERVGGEVALAGWDGAKEKRSLLGWAKPEVDCDPAFRDVAFGANGTPIGYRLRVASGGTAHLVFGFCEGVHAQAGQRLLALSAEGAAGRVVDPVMDFGARRPGTYRLDATDADRNGVIDISVAAAPAAGDRNVVLNALWAFAGEVPPVAAIVAGSETDTAYAFANCGVERLPTRRNVMLIRLKNTRPAVATRRPVLRIEGVAPVRFHAAEGLVAIGHATRVLASGGIESCVPEGKNWLVKLPAVRLAPGEEKQLAVTIVRHGHRPFAALSVAEAAHRRDETQRWWQAAGLPFEVIQVPDAGIQGMLDSCVRNIWQSRDIIQGRPAFHVGPTIYRCLWVVDGAFLLETAAMLGRGREARAGIEYLLGFQEPHGGFELKAKFWKEDGLVLWTVVRHAQLTDDRAWLAALWPRLERVVGHIQALRREASRDPAALHYGLLPPGDIDGGINLSGEAEFSNTYWCLIGLQAAIGAARGLGRAAQAAEWQSEYDDFLAAFRRAAARDRRRDPHGNSYLPTMMANAGHHLPQRGQWAFCHAIHPGELFAADDPLVRGQLAMLGATRQQGLVFGTGWDEEGLWTYFASFYGHALLWAGRGGEAAQVLYDFANHAVPVRVWREEQRPVGKGEREVGDMPHNWASAEFIRLTAHLLALERGDEMHLFEGLPAQWTRPGMTTRLDGLATRFGPLELELRVANDGASARLRVGALPRAKKIVVHLHRWAADRPEATMEFAAGKPVDTTIRLPR